MGARVTKYSRLDKPLDWYQWNPLQWQSSRRVQRMSWAQRGIYRELMDECYLKGTIPADPEAVAKLLGEALEDIQEHLPAVLRCFEQAGEGRLMSPTIEDMRERQNEVRRSRIRADYKESDKDSTATTQDQHLTSVDPTQVRTTVESSSQLQNSARVEKSREENITTTRVHAHEGQQGKEPKLKKPSPLDIGNLPDWVPGLAKRIRDLWPKADPDGREIRVSMPQLVTRLAAIHTRQPRFTEAILEGAAKDYASSKRQRFKAPQYFFTETPDPNSGNKPPFLEWAQARVHLEEGRAKLAPPTLIPQETPA